MNTYSYSIRLWTLSCVYVTLQIFVEAISKLEIRESPNDVTTYAVYMRMKEIKSLMQYIPEG